MTRVTVWHDGSCPLCQREIAVMRWLDTRGAVTFVDAATDGRCPLDRGEMLARFHAREDGGPLLSGAAAFAAMWRAIPVLRPLGEIARNRLVGSVMERLYREFLRIRPRLQRWLAQREARA